MPPHSQNSQSGPAPVFPSVRLTTTDYYRPRFAPMFPIRVHPRLKSRSWKKLNRCYFTSILVRLTPTWSNLLPSLVKPKSDEARMIGLSATLGNPDDGKQFLAIDFPETVKLIQDNLIERQIRFALKAVLREPDRHKVGWGGGGGGEAGGGVADTTTTMGDVSCAFALAGVFRGRVHRVGASQTPVFGLCAPPLLHHCTWRIEFD